MPHTRRARSLASAEYIPLVLADRAVVLGYASNRRPPSLAQESDRSDYPHREHGQYPPHRDEYRVSDRSNRPPRLDWLCDQVIDPGDVVVLRMVLRRSAHLWTTCFLAVSATRPTSRAARRASSATRQRASTQGRYPRTFPTLAAASTLAKRQPTTRSTTDTTMTAVAADTTGARADTVATVGRLRAGSTGRSHLKTTLQLPRATFLPCGSSRSTWKRDRCVDLATVVVSSMSEGRSSDALCCEVQLQVAFASCNGVRDIRLVRDRATNESRGFAFVEFVDADVRCGRVSS